MAWYYWSIPIQVDLHFRPLDLKGSGRSRSADTCSLKWTDRMRPMEIQRTRSNRGGAHLCLGFRRAILRRGRLWLISGEATAASRRRRCYDGVQGDTGVSRAWSAPTFASRGGRWVIRLKRIHNFWSSMLVFTPFA
jgi:hypothetical protein